MNHAAQLQAINDRILTTEAPGEVFSACRSLYDLFVELTAVSGESDAPDASSQTELSCGQALSPRDAARCVLDFARTSMFLRGVNAAIEELFRRFPAERLEIVYAGTGPFATLITPLLHRYPGERVHITLLDVHQRSLDAVDALLRRLEARDRVDQLIPADVTEYRHPVPCHLIICELIQQGLRNEPQVAATLNLAPQLRERGIFVPQRISLHAEWASPLARTLLDGAQRESVDLGPVFSIEADAIRRDHNAWNGPLTVELPATEIAEPTLLLVMRIKVFGSFGLSGYDAGVTYPLRILNREPLDPGDRIEFSYQTGGSPQLVHRRIPAKA